MRISVRAAVAAASASMLALSVAPAAHAVPAPMFTPSSAPTASQDYYWQWSDTEELSTTRTFDQSQYGNASNLPSLIVSAEPASPRRTVTLKYYQHGKWSVEDKAKTNSKGEAVLYFDPMCNYDTAPYKRWCNKTFKYKVIINGQTAKFTIKYIR